MKYINHRLAGLTNPDAIRGERLVLALLSLGWGIYLSSPVAKQNFLDISGGFLFIAYAISIIFDILTCDNIKPSEGFYGVVIWSVGIAYQCTQLPIDDTIFVLWVPLVLSVWILANSLAVLKE